MSATEPLAVALARAATRFVSESKVGTRKGSVAAVAQAMSERGVRISKNTLSRKLAGDYPINSDELGALAAVIRVEPDEIWRDALRIMAEERGKPDPGTTMLEGMLRPGTKRDVDEARENNGVRKPPANHDEDEDRPRAFAS